MDFLYFTSPPQTHTPSWSGSVLSFSRSPLVIFALPDTLTLLLLPPPPQYCVFSCLLLRSCNHVRVLCWSIITEPKIEWLNTIHIAYLAGSGGRGAGSQAQLNRVLPLGVSHRPISWCWMEPQSSPLGTICFPTHSMGAGRQQCPWLGWVEGFFTHPWLVTRGSVQFLAR